MSNTGTTVCTVTITIIKLPDGNRVGHSRIEGELLDVITALRLAGEQHKGFKAAVIAAAQVLQKQP